LKQEAHHFEWWEEVMSLNLNNMHFHKSFGKKALLLKAGMRRKSKQNLEGVI